jgi:hypothetical protein
MYNVNIQLRFNGHYWIWKWNGLKAMIAMGILQNVWFDEKLAKKLTSKYAWSQWPQ